MSFTERMGIEVSISPIRVKSDAPREFRLYLLQLMLHYVGLKKLRSLVCFVTKDAEDPNNWGENDFMKNEVQSILENCPWNRIYDIIEYLYANIQKRSEFEKIINEYFIEKGIGWKLVNGLIETRGDEAFEKKIKDVIDVLDKAQLNTSKNEIKEAIKDLSKRPKADVTGSVQHSVAALECVCREISGDKRATLGKIIKDNSGLVPKPLDDVITKVFGFASEQGRHLREGGTPNFEEAELVVHLSASLCTYLVKKNLRIESDNIELLF